MRARSARPGARPDRRSASTVPAGRAELGELAGGVPVQRTLARQRLGQVAEHRQRGERDRRTVVVGAGARRPWRRCYGAVATTAANVHVVDARVVAPAAGGPRRRVHVTGAEGNLGPGAGAARRRPDVVDGSATASTSSSTSGPAITTCGPPPGERDRRVPPRCSTTRRSAGPATSCSCRRRWSTAPTPTTRCR